MCRFVAHKPLVGNSRNRKQSTQRRCLEVIRETHLLIEQPMFYLVPALKLVFEASQSAKQLSLIFQFR